MPLLPQHLQFWLEDITDEIANQTISHIENKTIPTSPKTVDEVASEALYQKAGESYVSLYGAEKMNGEVIIQFIKDFYTNASNDNHHIYVINTKAFQKLKEISFITGIDFNQLYQNVVWNYSRNDSFGILITSTDLYNPAISAPKSIQIDLALLHNLFGLPRYEVQLCHQLMFLIQHPFDLTTLYEVKQGLRQVQQGREQLVMHSVTKGEFIYYYLKDADAAMADLQAQIINEKLFRYGAQDNPEHVTYKTKDMLQKIFNHIGEIRGLPRYFEIEHVLPCQTK